MVIIGPYVMAMMFAVLSGDAFSCCLMLQHEAGLITPHTHGAAAVVALLDAQAILSQNLVKYI